jgi:hypothetical protein
MIAIAALAVLLGVMPALDRYRLYVSARIVESNVLIEVTLFEWRPAGIACGPAGCHANSWGFWRAGELIFQVDIVSLIAPVAAVASLLVLEVYRRSSRRQRDLLLSAANRPIENRETDRSGERERV